ncbi:MAG: hypothetical protein ACYTGX_14775, partial [Planctomycetota bacterium]
MLRKAYGGKLGSRSGRDAGAGSPMQRAAHVAKWLGYYLATGAGGLWLLALGCAGLGVWRGWRAGAATRNVAGTLAPAAAVALVLTGAGDMTGFLLVVLALGPLLGLYAAARATPQARLVSFLMLAWFVTGPLFIAYGVNFDSGSELHRAVVARFFVLPAVPLTLLGALGLQALGDWKGPAALKGAGVGSAVLAGVVALAGGASLAGVRGVEIYGRNLLASIPEDPAKPALLFVQGDVPNNAIDYLQYCEGARPDVAMLNQQKLTYPWAVRRYERRFAGDVHAVDVPGERYDGRLVKNLDLCNANVRRRRLYFFGIATGDTSYQAGYWRVPRGLVYAMVPKGTPLDLNAIERDGLAILESLDWPSILTTPGDAYFLDEVRNAHAKAWNDLALFFHTGPNGAGPPVDFAR